MMLKWERTTSFVLLLSNPSLNLILPKRRAPTMNLEILEYLKFLHIHNLVDIITIIESIPIFYQTQIRRTITRNNALETKSVQLQRMMLQNLTFIAKHGFNFSFPYLKTEFQTHRLGPYSLDIENELQNLVNSEIFNNAVSSKKQYNKRYMITEYDKKVIIDMFKGAKNYRNFLELVDGKDIFLLRDIALSLDFHNHCTNVCTGTIHKEYIANDINKYKILSTSLKGLALYKKDYNVYIKSLVDTVISININTTLQIL